MHAEVGMEDNGAMDQNAECAPSSARSDAVAQQATGSGSNTGKGSNSGSGSNTSSFKQLLAMQKSDPSDDPTDTWTEEQEAVAELLIRKLVQKQDIEMAELKERLEAASKQEMMKEEMVPMEAHMKTIRDLGQLRSDFHSAQQQELAADDERDELKDVIAGLEARHHWCLDRIRKQMSKIEADRGEENDQNDKEHELMMCMVEQEMKAAVLQGAVHKETSDSKDYELGIQKDAVEADRLIELLKVGKLQAILETARANIILMDPSHDAPPAKASAAADAAGPGLARQHKVEELLKVAQDSNEHLHVDVAAGRLAMLNMLKGHADDVAAMELQLQIARGDAAGPIKQKRPSESNARKGKGKQAQRLHDIVEDGADDENEDVAVTGLASQSDQTSGELKARVDMLEKAANDARNANFKLEDDSNDMDAQHISRHKRIEDKLEKTEDNVVLLKATLSLMREIAGEADVTGIGELEEARKSFANAQVARAGGASRNQQNLDDNHVAHLNETTSSQDQIWYFDELRRVDSIRLADLELALVSADTRHAQIEGELIKKLLLYEASAGKTSAEETPAEILAAEALEERMNDLEKEECVLRKILETKESNWKIELDVIETQQAVNSKRQEVVEKELAKERELSEQLQQLLDDQQCQFTEMSTPAIVEQPPMRSLWQKLVQELQILKCPSRLVQHLAEFPARMIRADSMPIPRSPDELAERPSLAAWDSCRRTCWEILLAIPSLIVMSCSTTSLEILDASKHTYVVWGPRTIGSSLSDFLTEKNMTPFLRRQMLYDEPANTEDFSLRHVTGMRFRHADGTSSEYLLICATLPEDANDCSMIVIASPIKESLGSGNDATSSKNEGRSGKLGPTLCALGPQTGGYDSQSGHDQSGFTITANDSISNAVMSTDYET